MSANMPGVSQDEGCRFCENMQAEGVDDATLAVWHLNHSDEIGSDPDAQV